MAKVKAEKQEDIESPQEQLKRLLKEYKEDHYNDEETVDYKVSTGSLLLDEATNGGVGPGVTRLCGQNNGGKTPESLELLSNFLKTKIKGRKKKGLYIKAEGKLSKVNMDRTDIKFVFSPEEWEDGTVFVLETNIYEAVIDMIKDLVNNNPTGTLYGIVFDSVDGLILRDDMKKGAQDAHKVAGPQLLSKKFLTAMNLAMVKRGHMVLMISQVSAEIKLDPYAKTPNRGGMFSGGNALLHFSNFTLEFQPRYQSDLILDPPTGKITDKKTKMLGHRCKVVIKKSEEENVFKTVEYPIKYGVKGGSGIWLEYELIDYMISWGFLKPKGAWLEVDTSLKKEIESNNFQIKEQFNGMDKTREFLEANPDLTNFLHKKFREIAFNHEGNKD